jgi:VanZ family protein
VAGGWMLAAAIVWLSVSPKPPGMPVPSADKTEHVLAYSVLMLWFALLYRRWRLQLAYALAWIAMGIALEFVQRWLGYRYFDVLDMVANAVGVALGWALAGIIGRTRRSA